MKRRVQMQTSPLQLENYFLKELRFSLNDDLKNLPRKGGKIKYENPDININVEIGMQEDNPRKWRCELTVESIENREGLPYFFKITFVGFFDVVEAYPESSIEVMAKANAPALLYSAARETLLPLTGRGQFPALVLPSVTFVQPMKHDSSKSGDSTEKATSRKTIAKKRSSNQG